MRINTFRGLLAGFHGDQPDPDVPELDRAGEEWVPRSLRIPEHAHPDWELYLQLDGTSEWEVGGRRYKVGPGSLFLPAPGVAHALVGAEGGSHHFVFAGIDVARVRERLPEVGPIGRRGGLFVTPDATRLIEPFRLLIREVSLDQPYRSRGIELAIDVLVVEASRLMEEPRERAHYIASNRAVLRARELIEQQPGLPWRQRDLAEACGLSASRLQQLFTLAVGAPPRKFLLQTRIRRARGMLESTDTPITEMAIELGFSSSQHFAVAFRRLTGESPTDFRRRRGGA